MNRTNLIEFLDLLKVEYREGGNGWFNISCPLASITHAGGTDSHKSFAIKVNDTKSGYHCFTCHRKGSLNDLAKILYQHGLGDHREFVAECEQESFDNIMKEDVTLPKTVIKTSDSEKKYRECTGKIHPYIRERGYKQGILKQFEVGYDIDMNYITFPVRDYELNLVGIIGRRPYDNISKTDSKYFKYWFDAKNYLYGEHLINPLYGDLILVEGNIDVMAIKRLLTQNNIHMNVAGYLMGTLTDEQIEKVLSFADRVILFNDRDLGGIGGGKKMYHKLKNDIICLRVDYPEDYYGDPEEYCRDYPKFLVNQLLDPLLILD